jgi:hypothetical protein
MELWQAIKERKGGSIHGLTTWQNRRVVDARQYWKVVSLTQEALDGGASPRRSWIRGFWPEWMSVLLFQSPVFSKTQSTVLVTQS